MTTPLEQRFRAVRVVHIAMLAFVAMLVPLGERFAKEAGDVGLFLGIFAAVAAVDAVIALILRKSLVGSAEERLRQHPEDAAAIMRWFTGHIISFAMAESVALFGFMLRVMGATLEQAAGFYAAGLGLLLIFWPRRPQ